MTDTTATETKPGTGEKADLDRIWKKMPKADRIVLLGTDSDTLSTEERARFVRLAAGLRTGSTPAVPAPRSARRGGR